jgi:hypothetical protein
MAAPAALILLIAVVSYAAVYLLVFFAVWALIMSAVYLLVSR